MRAIKFSILLIILLKSTVSFSQYGKYSLNVIQTITPSSGISVGDYVTITLSVVHNNYVSCDSWMNGVTLDLGPGFDASTINYISAPSLTWISAGVANDMPTGTIGWGYDVLNNSNPFSSWGKSGAGPFVFELEVQVVGVSNVSDLDVDVFYSSDFDTGAYSGGNCGVINSPDGPYFLAPSIALPIKLISFYGASNDKENKLSWVTETEINNDFFILEKSYDAISFEEVEMLSGAGNSVENIRYESLDLNPQNLTYYRLTQVDFDGSSEASKIIVVTNSNFNKGEDAKLLKTVNSSGQVVTKNYPGVLIEYYADGRIEKKIRL